MLRPPAQLRALSLELLLFASFALIVCAASVRAEAQSSAGSSRPSGAAAVSPLATHISPYLRGHAADPVRWRLWNEAALGEARDSGKLLLVSSGYFACHWCHVMQEQSYADASVAAWLNQHMVSVKVDRELHPALDAHLIHFVERTTGQAGWPLHVVLTPEGYPLVGFTYLPREQFTKVLMAVHSRWEADAEALAALARRAHQQLRTMRAGGEPRTMDATLAARLRARLDEQLMQAADTFSGGFGDQAKFPSVPQLRALLEFQGPAEAREQRLGFLGFTLAQMASQALRDQIGGGFFRYVTDPTWETPHFEKMLYDNAQLAALYLDAARELDAPGFEAVGLDTLRFMAREMWDPRGGFIASMSAIDEQGVEGGHYLLDEAELATLSAQQRGLAEAAWGLSGRGALPGGDLPRQTMPPARLAGELGIPPAVLNARLGELRQQLLAMRDASRLPLDEKILSGWNGLALSALSRTSGDPALKALARRLADTLATRMWDGQTLAAVLPAHGGQHSGADVKASLYDHAYVARGLADAGQALSDPALALTAAALVKRAVELFFDAADGGWQLGQAAHIELGGGRYALGDRGIPAPQAVLIATGLELADAAADAGLRGRLLATLAQVEGDVSDNAFNFASHIGVLARVYPGGSGQGGSGQ